MNKTLHIIPLLNELEKNIRDFFDYNDVPFIELFGKSQLSISKDGFISCQKPAIIIIFGGITGTSLITQKDQITIEFLVINDSEPNTYPNFEKSLETCQKLFNFLSTSSIPGIVYYTGNNSYNITVIDDSSSYDIKLNLSMTFTIIN